jgi:AAA+ ATPase superfamily predicted ATPase
VSAVSEQDLDLSITPQSLRGKFIASLVKKGLSNEIVKNNVFSFSTRVDDSKGLLFVDIPDIPDLPSSLFSDSENIFKVLCVSEVAMKFEANLFFVLRCFGVKLVNFCILNFLFIFII